VYEAVSKAWLSGSSQTTVPADSDRRIVERTVSHAQIWSSLDRGRGTQIRGRAISGGEKTDRMDGSGSLVISKIGNILGLRRSGRGEGEVGKNSDSSKH